VTRLSAAQARRIAVVAQGFAGRPAGPVTRAHLRRVMAKINVLQLAAEGYSNPALADKLCLSDSTVRTHLRNINSKLSTRNRTQAVAVARRLGQIR